jgi:hypothetical protein
MPDFNDANKLGTGKELVDRLTHLIGIFENRALDFSRNRADGDDILGDAYEYLMRHFATESGKSKGQFYTPAEVSRIMAKIIGIHEPLRYRAVEQPFAVLREDRMLPDRIVHAQANEPAKQQVVVDLLDQQDLRTDRLKHLQQQRSQQVLGSDRRATRRRIKLVKILVQGPKHLIGQLADRTQRVALRHSLLQRNIAEHPILNLLSSTHTD